MVAERFAGWNESDISAEIVRPLLKRLGYAMGTVNSIRSELTFRYGKAFLGRKKPSKDPGLEGRADFILDAIPYGRWVVEVKGPSEKLDRSVVEQAHTYAAHPEVAAQFFMVTNGHAFEVYETGRLAAPALSVRYDEMDEQFLRLENLLGPVAIRRRAHLLKPDEGKPLGQGLASRLEIIGGRVLYDDHVSDNAFLANIPIKDTVLPVTGGFIEREPDGRIHAYITIASANSFMPSVTSLLGVGDDYHFYSADEYVSSDADHPTIFQNFVNENAEAGRPLKLGIGTIDTGISYNFQALTDASGFLDGNIFYGTMDLDYDFEFLTIAPMMRAVLQQLVGPFPDRATMKGGGRFEVRVRAAPSQ